MSVCTACIVGTVRTVFSSCSLGSLCSPCLCVRTSPRRYVRMSLSLYVTLRPHGSAHAVLPPPGYLFRRFQPLLPPGGGQRRPPEPRRPGAPPPVETRPSKTRPRADAPGPSSPSRCPSTLLRSLCLSWGLGFRTTAPPGARGGHPTDTEPGLRGPSTCARPPFRCALTASTLCAARLRILAIAIPTAARSHVCSSFKFRFVVL